MATHHSKTSRTKGPDAQIVVPSWDSVWASFRETNETTTIEAMNADGWKTIEQAAQEVGLSRSHLNAMALRGEMELKKKKIIRNGAAREINFVRPKATTCQ